MWQSNCLLVLTAPLPPFQLVRGSRAQGPPVHSIFNEAFRFSHLTGVGTASFDCFRQCERPHSAYKQKIVLRTALRSLFPGGESDLV
jgi:hypothetical protein